MILETYTQVNTNFFYSLNDFEFDEFKTLKSKSVNPKKLDQNRFEAMLEHKSKIKSFEKSLNSNKINKSK